MATYLGWDCANRTLAWSYVKVDTNIFSHMREALDGVIDCVNMYVGADVTRRWAAGLYTQADGAHLADCLADDEFTHALLISIQEASRVAGGLLTYKSAGVVDLLAGQKVAEVTEVGRTRALWMFLTGHPILSAPEPDTRVIIEHQPAKIGVSANNNSTVVSHNLVFYYINYDPVFVDPKLKNKIHCASGMEYETYLRATTRKSAQDARYAARKKHSKDNFLLMIRVLGHEHILAGIKSAVYDDLADSTMQIIAYLVENKMFV